MSIAGQRFIEAMDQLAEEDPERYAVVDQAFKTAAQMALAIVCGFPTAFFTILALMGDL